jgi:hypothetical protein
MRKYMIELLAFSFFFYSFVALVVGAVLFFMKPKHLKVSAAIGSVNLTVEADSGDAPKASPPREVLESWSRAITTWTEGLNRPAVGIPGSGTPDVGS